MKQRRGILKISNSLLREWMRLPPGTEVIGVRAASDFCFFEVLVQGAAIPETEECQRPPYLVSTVKIVEPEVSFSIVNEADAV